MTDTGQDGLGTRLSASYLVLRSITPVCFGYRDAFHFGFVGSAAVVRSMLVSQAIPNQPQHGSLSASLDTESDPHWGWLGMACETRSMHISTASCSVTNLQISACMRGDIIH